MEERKYDELEQRASLSAELDHVKRMETRLRVHQEIEKMRESGEAQTLTAEEMEMLFAFRRFKLRMRKDGELFTWQTRRPDGVQLAEQTAEIVHPNEVR